MLPRLLMRQLGSMFNFLFLLIHSRWYSHVAKYQTHQFLHCIKMMRVVKKHFMTLGIFTPLFIITIFSMICKGPGSCNSCIKNKRKPYTLAVGSCLWLSPFTLSLLIFHLSRLQVEEKKSCTLAKKTTSPPFLNNNRSIYVNVCK